MVSARFFAELFDAIVSDEQLMYIWIPNSGSVYFADTNQAAAYAQSRHTENVYFGLGTTSKNLGANKRPSALQVSSIPGLWLDIDIAGPAHKKENLPASHEDAIDLLKSSLPLPPTILVDSGHGLHAYWLFKEPWMFETEDERQQAASLMRRFVLSFKYHAAVRGWAMDSVFDLARVLRVPGTLNTKPGAEQMLCSVRDADYERRYNPDEFYQFLVDTEEVRNDDDIAEMLSADRNPFNLFLRHDAAPPWQKFDAMKEIEPRFILTWDKRRRDLQDQSPSSYDMALINLLVSYKWAEQDIANTVIAFRRKHAKNDREAKKALRVDYITRTIMKAKKVFEKFEDDEQEAHCDLNEEILELTEQNMAAERDPSVEPPSKEAIAKMLEPILKVKIKKLVKYVCDEPKFEMVLEDGSVLSLGTIDKIINQRHIKNVIAAHKGKIIKIIKAPAWDQYATLLMQLVEEVTPAAEDATEKGNFISTLELYLEAKGIITDRDSAFSTGRPFWHDSKAYIFSSDFVNWTKFNAEPMSKHNFAMTAASLSVQSRKMHFKVGPDEAQKTTTRAVYDITGYVTGRVTDSPASLITEVEDRPEAFQ
jgi:hypothetical protein